MARTIDLHLEGKVRELRAQGMGVRQIARTVKTSPSTISRLLRGSVDHNSLAELTVKVNALLKRTEILAKMLQILMRPLAYGHPFRNELSSLLAQFQSVGSELAGEAHSDSHPPYLGGTR